MSETQSIEYKSTWHDDHLAWICGFANAQGGTLVVGVDDDGNPVGLLNYRKLLEDIPNKLRQTMGIICDVNLVGEAEGLPRLIITVPPYPVPITYRGQLYYRSGATNQLLTGAALSQFLMAKEGRTWDMLPQPSAHKEDLRLDVIRRFQKAAIAKGRLAASVVDNDLDAFLDNMHLLDRETGHLTNAAVLLFHQSPGSFFTGAHTKIGYFETADWDLRYQDDVEGPLVEQAEQVLEILRLKYLKAPIHYEGTTRIDQYPYPLEAIREAVYNAIVHKQYATGIPIQIKVFPDKLIIANKGRPPQEWTMDTLLGSHVSEPFNPGIAGAFYLSGAIESWGRGIRMIVDSCRNDGIPEPAFELQANTTMVTFTTVPERVVWEETPQATPPVTPPVAPPVTPLVEALLDVLAEKELQTNEIMQALGLSDRKNFRRNYLNPALEAGLIERTIPDNPGSRLQRYRRVR